MSVSNIGPGWAFAVRLLLVAAVPVVIIFVSLRIVLVPWYLQFEYSRAGLSTDASGFTEAERLQYARTAIDYLMAAAGDTRLKDATAANGQPLYNERELSHMVDVQVVVQSVLRVGQLAALVLGGGALMLGFMRQYHDLRTGLLWGAIGLVAGLLLLLAYIGINFESFFTNFHQVFFASGTWTFEYTDTLIRLFPIQFWADVSVLVVAAALAQGALLWWAAASWFR